MRYGEELDGLKEGWENYVCARCLRWFGARRAEVERLYGAYGDCVGRAVSLADMEGLHAEVARLRPECVGMVEGVATGPRQVRRGRNRRRRGTEAMIVELDAAERGDTHGSISCRSTPTMVELDPHEIRYTHGSISCRFRSGAHLDPVIEEVLELSLIHI